MLRRRYSGADFSSPAFINRYNLTPLMRRTIILVFLLAVALSASARDQVDHWLEVRTQHFVVLTDTNEKQGRRVATQL